MFEAAHGSATGREPDAQIATDSQRDRQPYSDRVTNDREVDVEDEEADPEEGLSGRKLESRISHHVELDCEGNVAGHGQ